MSHFLCPTDWTLSHHLHQLNCVSLSLPWAVSQYLCLPSTKLCLNISDPTNWTGSHSLYFELCLSIYVPNNWAVSHYLWPNPLNYFSLSLLNCISLSMSPTSWAVYHYLCPALCITIYLPHQLNCVSLFMSPINWAVAQCICLCQLNCVSLSLPHHLNYVSPSPSPTELCLTISASSNLMCHYPCPSPPTELSLPIFSPTNWIVSHYLCSNQLNCFSLFLPSSNFTTT